MSDNAKFWNKDCIHVRCMQFVSIRWSCIGCFVNNIFIDCIWVNLQYTYSGWLRYGGKTHQHVWRKSSKALQVSNVLWISYTYCSSTECRQALKASRFLGLRHALNDTLMYFLIAIVYRFGAFLITLGDDHILHLEFDDLYM